MGEVGVLIKPRNTSHRDSRKKNLSTIIDLLKLMSLRFSLSPLSIGGKEGRCFIWNYFNANNRTMDKQMINWLATQIHYVYHTTNISIYEAYRRQSKVSNRSDAGLVSLDLISPSLFKPKGKLSYWYFPEKMMCNNQLGI